MFGEAAGSADPTGRGSTRIFLDQRETDGRGCRLTRKGIRVHQRPVNPKEICANPRPVKRDPRFMSVSKMATDPGSR